MDPVMVLGMLVTALAVGMSWLVREVNRLQRAECALLALMNELERRLRVLEEPVR